MKYIQGHTFTVKQKPKRNFKLGETYRIYHIGKVVEENETKLSYTFYSKSGPLQEVFTTSQEAELIIDKMSGT